MQRLVLSLAGAVAGYALILVGAVLFQDLLFGGVSHGGSSAVAILVGGGMTALSAVAGGYAASRIVQSRTILPVSILVGWLIFEGTYLYVNGIVAGPLWFELLASASLIGGVVAGAFLCRRVRVHATA